MNDVPEITIQTIVDLARTLVIDISIHWLDQTVLELYPMVTDHTIWVCNNTPKKGTGFYYLELFTRSHSSHKSLNRLRIWGCPDYVL